MLYILSPEDRPYLVRTRRGPCQHGFMCGCKQWSTDINESNYNMQPITIKFSVRVRKDYTHALHVYLGEVWGTRCLN